MKFIKLIMKFISRAAYKNVFFIVYDKIFLFGFFKIIFSQRSYQINNEPRSCGVKKSKLLIQFCGEKFDVNIKIGAAKEYSGLRMYYEVAEIFDVTLCGEDPIEKTTTLDPIIPTTTKV